jgi:hypothetical protein
MFIIFHFSPQKYDIFLIQANNHTKLSQEKAERLSQATPPVLIISMRQLYNIMDLKSASLMIFVSPELLRSVKSLSPLTIYVAPMASAKDSRKASLGSRMWCLPLSSTFTF